MVDTIPAPFRTQFDEARDPLTARNRLGAAGLTSPVFTGDPQVPTASPGDNDNSAASTAFVTAAIAASGGSYATTANFPAGAWTAWTPTITSSVGTIISTTINRAKYIKLGKTVIAQIDITITNAGTGAGSFIVTMPVTAVTGTIMGFGREVVGTGSMLAATQVSTTSAGAVKYENTSFIATNNRPVMTIIYEAA